MLPFVYIEQNTRYTRIECCALYPEHLCGGYLFIRMVHKYVILSIDFELFWTASIYVCEILRELTPVSVWAVGWEGGARGFAKLWKWGRKKDWHRVSGALLLIRVQIRFCKMRKSGLSISIMKTLYTLVVCLVDELDVLVSVLWREFVGIILIFCWSDCLCRLSVYVSFGQWDSHSDENLSPNVRILFYFGF